MAQSLVALLAKKNNEHTVKLAQKNSDREVNTTLSTATFFFSNVVNIFLKAFFVLLYVQVRKLVFTYDCRTDFAIHLPLNLQIKLYYSGVYRKEIQVVV